MPQHQITLTRKEIEGAILSRVKEEVADLAIVPKMEFHDVLGITDPKYVVLSWDTVTRIGEREEEK